MNPPPQAPALPPMPRMKLTAPNIAMTPLNLEQKSLTEIDRLVEREIVVCEYLTDKIYQQFRPVVTIPQTGPTCGLVALSMGLSLLNIKVNPNGLYHKALSFGWTNLGEMFSCEWMANLAETTGATAFTIKSGIHNHLGCLINCLAQGGSILVPYDKDKNFAPYLGGGKSAHWALITGILCLASSPSAKLLSNTRSCFQETKTHCSTNLIMTDNAEWHEMNRNDVSIVPYVLAYHGLSAKVAMWSLSELSKSNENLLTTGEPFTGWIKLPPGGIEDGLCGQAVLLLPNQNQDS